MSAEITPTVSPLVGGVGNTVRVTGQLLVNSLPVDPTTFRITVTDPSGVGEDFIWPSNPDAVQVEMGKWYVDVDVPSSGLWEVEMASTGTGTIALGRTAFRVEPVKEQLRVAVTDQDDDPVVGVRVMAWSPGRVRFHASGTTDSNGLVTVRVVPGDYEVTCEKAKTAFVNPTDVTVLDTGGTDLQDLAVEGTVLDITATARPKTVHLFGHVISSGGEFLPGVRVIVEEVSYGRRSFVPGETGTDTAIDAQPLMIAPTKREVLTGADGYWEIQVVARTLVRVSIPDARFERIFRVPSDVPTLNIRDARPDPGAGTGVGIDADHGGRDTLEGPGMS